ncbi:MAG: sigma-70 family RNA polymerase sigma factor [Clostridiales bacterium]|nr:sigma-70 family RNA polymerase sigma factor [bacterium 210917-SL.2.15]MCI5842392.1 sigma-70 family RNA polymerase sigma factor [Clostridiales bacterium]MDY4036980.1 sigma-70 family RNA polymerase sigma factor [Candidatus Pseudoscilispira sp.]
MLAHLLLLLPTEQDRERVWFLYQKLKEKLMYAVMQLLQQRDLAEDAVEDAFLYLIHHFHELDTADDQRVAAYLYQCVRRYALQELRRQKREGEALEDEVEDDMIGLEERMIDMQQCAAVKAALKALPDRHRLMLEYRFYNEWTVGQIAEATGLTEGAVYKRLKRAGEALAQRLKEAGVF